MSRWRTGSALVVDNRENDFNTAGWAGNNINNTLYEVFADSVLFIDIEVDMKQIEYDGEPIGAVYNDRKAQI